MPPVVQVWACGNRSRALHHFGSACLAHSTLFPWRFTLPCLNGSAPLHSFVLPVQGVETDCVYKTCLCPYGCDTRFSVHLWYFLRMSQHSWVLRAYSTAASVESSLLPLCS